MSKPSAVIDKSLFHEICLVDSAEDRESYWKALDERYQLIVPFILIEEVLVNVVRPGKITRTVLERMAAQLLALHSCWMEEVTEIAFRELVEKQALAKLPAVDPYLLEWLQTMREDDPALIEWVEERNRSRKETARFRKQQQDKEASSAKSTYVANERDFFEKTVKPAFMCALHDPSLKVKMLERILGMDFRTSHPKVNRSIDAAFADFGPGTFMHYPMSVNILVVWFAYMFGPIRMILAPGESEPREILEPSAKAQRNNPFDEKYVVSALICERLLTRDRGMHNITSVFQAVGLWHVIPVFLDPNGRLAEQIPRLLV